MAIPCYRPVLDPDERLSARQCRAVLGRHALKVVAPVGLDLPGPLADLPCERFSAEAFADIGAYNRLLLGPEFYGRFASYEYLLIHQLDAYVFRDELDEWCGKKWDYVGAPWPDDEFLQKRKWRSAFPRHLRPPTLARWIRGCDFRVGNGGFSLRRIPAFLAVLDRQPAAARAWPANEDVFWSLAAPVYDRKFRIPPEREAMRFAVEREPARYLARLAGRLPFGCHAWRKRGFEVWKPHLRAAG